MHLMSYCNLFSVAQKYKTIFIEFFSVWDLYIYLSHLEFLKLNLISSTQIFIAQGAM